MTDHFDDIVRVAAGPLIQVEMWQGVLKDAGIRSKVVGTDLTAGFGSALQGSIELWVHTGDAARAAEMIRDAEAARGGNDE